MSEFCEDRGDLADLELENESTLDMIILSLISVLGNELTLADSSSIAAI